MSAQRKQRKAYGRFVGGFLPPQLVEALHFHSLLLNTTITELLTSALSAAYLHNESKDLLPRVVDKLYSDWEQERALYRRLTITGKWIAFLNRVQATLYKKGIQEVNVEYIINELKGRGKG